MNEFYTSLDDIIDDLVAYKKDSSSIYDETVLGITYQISSDSLSTALSSYQIDPTTLNNLAVSADYTKPSCGHCMKLWTTLHLIKM